MSLIIALLIGGLVGWLANRVTGREDGIIMTVIIGVIGSLIGSFVSSVIVGTDLANLAFSWSGIFWSFVGALVLVFILNFFQRGSHHPA
ncbi:MAG: hypothetical protein QG549_386 [Patescibacteria group bacterium]|nr:hypothetical protein [Patescibacteria group bacterium]